MFCFKSQNLSMLLSKDLPTSHWIFRAVTSVYSKMQREKCLLTYTSSAKGGGVKYLVIQETLKEAQHTWRVGPDHRIPSIPSESSGHTDPDSCLRNGFREL